MIRLQANLKMFVGVVQRGSNLVHCHVVADSVCDLKSVSSI